jgi:hypothetical protein
MSRAGNSSPKDSADGERTTPPEDDSASLRDFIEQSEVDETDDKEAAELETERHAQGRGA